MRPSVAGIVRAWQKAGKVKAVFLADDQTVVTDVDRFLEQDIQNTCVYDGNYGKLVEFERQLRKRVHASFPAADDSYLAVREATKRHTSVLNRLLVAADSKGELLLSGGPPRVPLTMPRILRNLQMPMGSLHTWPSILGMRGAEEWEKHGILIPNLGAGVRIYPRYSVFPPTQQMKGEAAKGKMTYVEALSAFWERPENKNLGSLRTALEIGSGTGVLSFLFGKLFPRTQIVGLDTNPEATACAQENLSRLRWPSSSRFIFATTNPLDNLEWRQEVTQQTNHTCVLSATLEYIFSNPPWIADVEEQASGPGSPFRLQSGRLHGAIWDDLESAFLPKLFAFAERNLASHGRLCILHSDIAVQLLGKRAVTVPGVLERFPSLAIMDVARYPTLVRKGLQSDIEIWTVGKR